MIWIIGEYAERIDNADELLEQFLETFPEEQSMVRPKIEAFCHWDDLDIWSVSRTACRRLQAYM